MIFSGVYTINVALLNIGATEWSEGGLRTETSSSVLFPVLICVWRNEMVHI